MNGMYHSTAVVMNLLTVLLLIGPHKVASLWIEKWQYRIIQEQISLQTATVDNVHLMKKM